MTVRTTLLLAAVMTVVALVNTALMAWLWRFPMVPDPSGRDPNGVSTAPRSWTNVHRGLGYLFALCYLALLTAMLPRLWQFRDVTVSAAVHALFGVALGMILVGKVLIIRRFPRFGGRLPWVGGTLTLVTLAAVGLATIPALRVVRPFSELSPPLAERRAVLEARCFQCHGAATIAREREDAEKWDRLVRQMQRRSRRYAGKLEITDEDRVRVVPYLVHVLGEAEDEEEAEGGEGASEGDERDAEGDDESGGRRRRRGR